MKQVVLAIMLIIAASPAYALTHKESQKKRHQPLHLLHHETVILKKWMADSEEKCAHSSEFHDCYVESLKSIHNSSKVKFSPETEKTFKELTKPPRKKD